MPIPLEATQALRVKQGRLIRKYRLNRGRTQEQIADTLGVTKAAVSLWERGSASPVAVHQVALAKALGVPWFALFGLSDEDVA